MCIAVTIGCHGDARMPKQLIIEETELTHTTLVIVSYCVVTHYLAVLLVTMAMLDWHLCSGQPGGSRSSTVYRELSLTVKAVPPFQPAVGMQCTCLNGL